MLRFVGFRNSIVAMQLLRWLLMSVIAVVLIQNSGFARPKVIRTTVRLAKVTVATAKLRLKPNESSRTLGLLDHAANLSVLSSKSGWIQVQTKRGTKGWVRRDLIEIRTSTVVKLVPAKRTADQVKIPKVVALKPAVTQRSVSVTPKTKVTPKKLVAAAVGTEFAESPVTFSDGQLPELVKTNDADGASRVEIHDPISAKRSSVVDYAQGAANASKTSSPVRSTLMSRANSQRGTPYRYGTSGGGTYDCSGFTSAMYRKVGVKLPRTAAEQFGVGLRIGKGSLTKGDLVFFSNTAGRRGISHVGIYSGNGMFIHASSRGHAVRIDTLSSGYYASHFAGGRRLIR